MCSEEMSRDGRSRSPYSSSFENHSPTETRNDYWRRCYYCRHNICCCPPIASSSSSGAPRAVTSSSHHSLPTASSSSSHSPKPKATRATGKSVPVKSTTKSAANAPKPVSRASTKSKSKSKTKSKPESAPKSRPHTTSHQPKVIAVKSNASPVKHTSRKPSLSLSGLFKRTSKKDDGQVSPKAGHQSHKIITDLKKITISEIEEKPINPPSFQESVSKTGGDESVHLLPEYSTEPPPKYEFKDVASDEEEERV
ncbi:hypothetical protein KGF57_004057 [Candida theae]|uniref:Uncharacterized protein n=1 Tax=Candida theae TaxID=1198502 RepID=A0AAD5BBY1_9ASCO|nr:uncharacterized protein KGF57_004057 [Candida theae]KAI5953065.1 hypothetical protein KGF57_004057 [Candida theae]